MSFLVEGRNERLGSKESLPSHGMSMWFVPSIVLPHSPSTNLAGEEAERLMISKYSKESRRSRKVDVRIFLRVPQTIEQLFGRCECGIKS